MKIIQIIMAPNNDLRHGQLLGLGDDGVVYAQTWDNKWEPIISCQVTTALKAAERDGE